MITWISFTLIAPQLATLVHLVQSSLRMWCLAKLICIGGAYGLFSSLPTRLMPSNPWYHQASIPSHQCNPMISALSRSSFIHMFLILSLWIIKKFKIFRKKEPKWIYRNANDKNRKWRFLTKLGKIILAFSTRPFFSIND